MKELCRNSSSRLDMTLIDSVHDQFEQVSFGCSSSSFDGMCSEALSLSFGLDDHGHGDDTSSCTDASSPLGWIPRANGFLSLASKQATQNNSATIWTEKGNGALSELDMLKEKFSKLLLGEDMSGGAKGVCSALAISNAITNLSASVFGEIWRLEPLPAKHKALWRREMGWLLSIADYIVELVPSLQSFPDGSNFEIMVSRPRTDIQVNLPALRKLDAMLLESLDSFSKAEFWYVDQGIMDDEYGHGVVRASLQKNQEKWWLPTPKVPANGLPDGEKKKLQHQRDCINQILKAALAINSQLLSEMEIPEVYWNAIPKNGKASLGETLYKNMSSEAFSPEAFLASCDLSTEHKAVELINRMEAVIHVWRRRTTEPKIPHRPAKNARNSWAMVKDIVSDGERREVLANRAEVVLLYLKQKFPALRQSLLDMTKIQYNKDVGQSILESYSRVLESVASNIIARIDDLLYVDDKMKLSLPSPSPAGKSGNAVLLRRGGYSRKFSIDHEEVPFELPLKTPCVSPTQSPSPGRTPNSPLDSCQTPHLSDYIRFRYEESHDGNYGGNQSQKKLLVPSRSSNGNKLPFVHPVYTE